LIAVILGKAGGTTNIEWSIKAPIPAYDFAAMDSFVRML